MRLKYLVWLLPLGGGLLGQTQIGGGTCNSSTLSGNYSFTLAGRQVAGSGAFVGVLQANGTATFDGTNKVSLKMSAATLQAPSLPLTYSGTYSVQANCGGSVMITAGTSATFSLLIFNQGKSFLIVGTDASYTYSGSGGLQPATCSTALLSGVYVFSASGFALEGGTIVEAVNAGGVLQLDGKNAISATFTYVAPSQGPMTQSLTGTYSASSGCSGTGTLVDALGNSYSLGFTASGGTSAATTTFDTLLTQTDQLLFTGTAHAVYGQPVGGGE
jgi:hypothetical protein